MDATRDNVPSLLIRQLTITWIALPFDRQFSQTAAVGFRAPTVYPFADYLEALRGATLEFFLSPWAKSPAYMCRLDHAQHSRDRTGEGNGAFGLISTPLPAFADLPPGTQVVLRDRHGNARSFPFGLLRQVG